MTEVLLQMMGLIVCGVAWRILRPGGVDYQTMRKALTTLVYYLLLPALGLSVLWKAQLGVHTLGIALSAIAGVCFGLVCGMLICRLCLHPAHKTGAMILAMAFPNVTYLGLPVLEATFGSWARGVAIQTELFATTPMLFTAGVFMAARFGQHSEKSPAIGIELLQIPALWTGILAVILNLAQVNMPSLLESLLQMLGRGVVPLMLFSLGLSLGWSRDSWRMMPAVLPVVLVRLVIVPALVLLVAILLGLQGELRAAVIMEAAMPSMVIGLVLCDRFGLDVDLYAVAVTVTTAVSMITLPLWHHVLL